MYAYVRYRSFFQRSHSHFSIRKAILKPMHQGTKGQSGSSFVTNWGGLKFPSTCRTAERAQTSWSERWALHHAYFTTSCCIMLYHAVSYLHLVTIGRSQCRRAPTKRIIWRLASEKTHRSLSVRLWLKGSPNWCRWIDRQHAQWETHWPW